MKRKIFSLLLALLLCFTFVSGCGKEEAEDVPEGIVKRTYQGTHIYTAPDTDYDLVKDGRTEYHILLAQNPEGYTRVAMQELQLFFKQATGITLITDFEGSEGLTHNASQKYISIGHTKLMASAGIEIDPVALNQQGVRIVTVDQNVFLCGGDQYGDVYSVYDFLQILFNFDFFTNGCWTIDEGKLNVKLPKFDVTDVPDVAYRQGGWGDVTGGSTRNRMRLTYPTLCLGVGDIRNGAGTAGFHNTSELVPTGPNEWFSDNGNQLCFTAHGDDEQFEALADYIADVVEYNIQYTSFNTQTGLGNPRSYDDWKYIKYFIISPEDTGGACTCLACQRFKANCDGAISGTLICLANRVMEKIKDWMNQPENAQWKKDDFMCMVSAYASTILAPAHYDEAAGKYVASCEECTPRQDVGADFCINTMNYVNNIYASVNDVARKNCEAWFDICPKTTIWTYALCTTSYLTFHDTFPFYNSDSYQFFASSHPIKLYAQGGYNTELTSCFVDMHNYIDAKMMWDSNLDQEVLIQKFLNGAYGEAADVMFELYKAERLLYNKIGDAKGFYTSVYTYSPQYETKEYFPLSNVREFLDLIETAFAICEEAYKVDNPARYEVVKYNLERQYVSPCYIVTYFYTKESAGELWTECAKFLKYTAANHPGYYNKGEHTSQTATDSFKALNV